MNEEESKTEDRPPLIFRWKKPRLNWRFHFFIFASLLGHVFAFYIFRVVYPPAVQVTPQTTRVTLLQPSDPRAMQFLRALEDRTFSLGSGGGENLTEELLASRRASFRPSFLGHEIALRDLPRSEPDLRLPNLIDPDEVVLPRAELPPRPPEPAAAEETRIPVVKPGREFGERTIEIDAGQLEGVEPPHRRFRALVAVRADGGLHHLMIDEEIESPLPENLAPWLRNAFRFSPADEASRELTWGWIEIIW